MNEWLKPYSNPVVMLAVLIIVSVIALIGASVLGLDKGVLPGMAKADFARGLITYLFAVVTIGIAVALVLSALAGPEPTDANDGRFQRGKEVLSLLLGVFGTIVGFYFGSEAARGSRPESLVLQVSPIDITPQPANASDAVTVRAVIRGGVSPYKFGVGQGSGNIELTDIAGESGWIVKQLQLGQGGAFVRVIVQDAGGSRAEQAAPLRVNP